MKYLATFALTFLLIPVSANAAIAFDNSGLKTLTASPSTLSAFAVAATNPIIWVATAGSTNYATGCTFNSIAMTRVQDFIHPTVADYHMSLFYIVGQSGTQDVTCSGTGSFTVEAQSYTGAKQTAIPDAQTTNSNVTTANITTNLTVGANAWVVTMGDGDTGGATDGTNYTQRQITGDNSFGDSNGALTGAISTTVTYASGSHSIILASFLPAASAPVFQLWHLSAF